MRKNETVTNEEEVLKETFKFYKKNCTSRRR